MNDEISTWTPNSGTPNNPADIAARRAWIVQRHHEGWTFDRIARELGISRPRAHEIYWDAINAIPAKTVSEHRAAMVDQLAEVIRVANGVLHGAHLAHSNGRVVVHPATGQPLTDDAPKLDAARTIVAAHARLAKLVGADAPTQVAQDVTVNYTVGGGVDVARDLT